MSEEIRSFYKKAGLAAPDGKGIHTERFHKTAIGIKKKNPSYPMSRCYKIAMGTVGRDKAVYKSHRREGYLAEASKTV